MTKALTIRPCTIDELFFAPEISALLDEYAAECAIEGLPHPKAKADMYRHLEAAGALYPVGAWLDQELIGFVAILSPILPHYGVCVSTTESLFVASAHRCTGAGLKLIRAAEQRAKEVCSPGLLVCAPMNGSLIDLLPAIGYRETNRVFFRRIADV